MAQISNQPLQISAPADNGTIIAPAFTGSPPKQLSAVIFTLTGSKTGIILAAGTIDGQELTIMVDGAFTITFAASGTSNVADGVASVVGPNAAARFKWSQLNALWYHVT